MSLDFEFDLATGDLVDAEDGGFASTATAAPAVYLQLRQHYDEWPPDPESGSRLHLAKDQGDGPDGEAFLETETRRAFAMLEADGSLSNLEVGVERSATGRIAVATSYVDTTSGLVVDDLLDPLEA